jgi:hypothetical protein
MSLITKGKTLDPPPSQRDLAPTPLVVDKANESPAAALNAVRAQENSQNMTNNMRGGWIPMGSNAYNIDQVNAVVNQNPRNASIGRRRLRRRERRALRHANAHGNNHGPYPHGYSQHRVTVKGFGGGGTKRTARFSVVRNRNRRSRFTRSSRRYRRAAIGSIQKRISRRVRMNLFHRKIRKSKNNQTQRRSRNRSRSQMQQGGEVTVPQHGVSCAGGAAQQNCPGNTSAALLDASRQAQANAQGDAIK